MGRKSLLARAFREHSLAERRRVGSRPVALDEVLAGLEGGTLTRRELLRYGGVLGAGLALASCTPSGLPAASVGPTGGSSATPHDARVVVVGAGLAGTTAAYRLSQAGVAVQLYEARDRIGGRCWTARGFADGQIAEHGGEFIDTRHVHIRQLARELGLKLDDLSSGYKAQVLARYVDGGVPSPHDTKPHDGPDQSGGRRRSAGASGRMARRARRRYSFGTATPGAMKMDQLSMADWLDANVPDVMGSAVGKWLDEVMASWYGLNLGPLRFELDGLLPHTHTGGRRELARTRGNDQIPIPRPAGCLRAR